MKVIGLIGGMSWESSLDYYRIINETVHDKLGGWHSAKIIMYSVDFSEIDLEHHRKDWDKSDEILTNAAKTLEKAGADFIIIGANTAHILADEIQKNMEILQKLSLYFKSCLIRGFFIDFFCGNLWPFDASR